MKKTLGFKMHSTHTVYFGCHKFLRLKCYQCAKTINHLVSVLETKFFLILEPNF